ncbi:MAG: hypothetical protein OXQ28_00250 [Acidobacteriota bacterium]|nr:hypothetical protein [Acidobacteriota bacterium]
MAVAIGVVYLGLAVAAGVVAATNGRSGFGWFILGLIFPFAILFVAIAQPVPKRDR